MSHDHSEYEYEYEPVPGLPEELPGGEAIVWQGQPTWGAMARRVFHANTIGMYFGALIFLHWVYRTMNGDALGDILVGVAWQVGLVAVALGILIGLARAYARSTMYTLTNRRLVVRSGVAIPMMINLPLNQVEAAGVRQHGDNTGDFVLTMRSEQKPAYWALWPNVRPWHWSRVQPMLRGVQDHAALSAALVQSVKANAGDYRVETGEAANDGGYRPGDAVGAH